MWKKNYTNYIYKIFKPVFLDTGEVFFVLFEIVKIV